MQAQETILFVVVAVLAAALIVALVAPRLRAGNREKGEPSRHPKEPSTPRSRHRSARPTPGTGLLREGEGATRGALLAAVASSPPPPPSPSSSSPPPPPLVHMICPTCRRQFAAGLRYCPYDARVLTADLHQSARPSQQMASIVNAGKICPSCARRYDSAALVCGRDGTALVSVN